MLANYEPDRDIEGLTDAEISEAICYLESDPPSAKEMGEHDREDDREDDREKDDGVVMWVCLYSAVLVCVAFMWFYWR